MFSTATHFQTSRCLKNMKKLVNFKNKLTEDEFKFIEPKIKLDLNGITILPDDLTECKKILPREKYHILSKIIKYQ